MGICIKIEELSAGQRSMWIYISGWQIVNLGNFSAHFVTGWHSWRSRQTWHWDWCRLLVSVRWRNNLSFAPAECPQILGSAILPTKASISVVMTKYSHLSFYRGLHYSIPSELNSPLLLFSDLGTRLLEQVLGFFYCSAQKPCLGHSGHIQRQAHVGLFQLYPTSLRCHSSRYVGNLQEISCCI